MRNLVSQIVCLSCAGIALFTLEREARGDSRVKGYYIHYRLPSCSKVCLA